ncbi:Hypothetical Protein FCC1311_100012 [Hondaea fermentalgiana]|uniref:Uncharacterized protein n=1 Tax=Hondaea fermentalgiana TaxID=2315210 RepID=A0A2R5GVH8_9STRA|nr:Hypothetical Protein FCC1311_100012 [Hondaea fermentalgiana]|eukprot:GBG33778.1 Hypothetical Protein FCC1311_100012 [Hondaea fermentalgiana]
MSAAQAQRDADALAGETEAVVTSVSTLFEKVLVQAKDVNDLCESMREQASFFARWNRLLADGARKSALRAQTAEQA